MRQTIIDDLNRCIEELTTKEAWALVFKLEEGIKMLDDNCKSFKRNADYGKLFDVKKDLKRAEEKDSLQRDYLSFTVSGYLELAKKYGIPHTLNYGINGYYFNRYYEAC